MVHKSNEIEISENVTIRTIDRFCDLQSLARIAKDLAHLLDEYWIVSSIFRALVVGTREDLRGIPRHKAAKIFGENIHTVRINQLRTMLAKSGLTSQWDRPFGFGPLCSPTWPFPLFH
jgi:hypothetical protein